MSDQTSDTETGEAGTPDMATADDVRAIVDHIMTMIDQLLETIARETERVRAGQLAAAADLAPRKSELANSYMMQINQIKTELATLRKLNPEAVTEIEAAHNRLKAELQINLAVLATAREVSGEIIRSVAEAVGATTKPDTYGARGDLSTGPSSARGLSVDQNL